MRGHLQSQEARGGIRYQVCQSYYQPWAGNFVKFGMQYKSEEIRGPSLRYINSTEGQPSSSLDI